MTSLKYKVISSKAQYKTYTDHLETLVFADSKTREIKDEIELLTVLIEKWDVEHSSTKDLHPIQLLKVLMEENKLKSKDLVENLSLSKGYVSEILSFKKGLSKDVIRKLAEFFKVSQEAFNRPYSLRSTTIEKSPKTRFRSVSKKIPI